MTGEACPLLLTPGPLTTAPETRAALDRDWGSRSAEFIAMTAALRRRLVDLAGVAESHVAVPLQGSGTFAVEAALTTLVPAGGHVLVAINGAYGRRMATILARAGRRPVAVAGPEDRGIDMAGMRAALAADPAIRHLAVVHCETTTGMLNPIEPVADLAAERGLGLIVDCMSSFGALPVAGFAGRALALVGSANKCLEGVPGLAIALVQRAALARAEDRAPSLSLDLHDQWRRFEGDGQWRFTPPVQVVAALMAALDGLDREGGPPGRLRRYTANRDRLVRGLARLGFETLLGREDQAPIIVTFRAPADAAFDFGRFHGALRARGFEIYPGKLATEASFRVGVIGAVTPDDIARFVAAVGQVMAAEGIPTGAPARAA